MVNFIKKYWDLIGGIIAGVVISTSEHFELVPMQRTYSAIILVLVCIGFFRLIRQEVGKKRDKTFVDGLVDGQKPIKAIDMAEKPANAGEAIGKKFLSLWRGTREMREKLKTIFDKFKGYMLTAALAVLTIVEMCGGFINQAFGGLLYIKGVAVLPLVTLLATIVVGVLSNGFTKEQREKIKALFSTADTNALVQAEIKKTIKEKTALLAQFNKLLSQQEHELTNLETEHKALKNSLDAKREMFNMKPQLASEADVQLATNEVVNCKSKITTKSKEIEATEKTIEELTTTITALKEQI